MSDAYCDAEDRELRMKRLQRRQQQENQEKVQPQRTENTMSNDTIYVVLKAVDGAVNVYGAYTDFYKARAAVTRYASQASIDGLSLRNIYQSNEATYQICECSLSR